MDLADYYDHYGRKINRMMHSSGPKRRYMAIKQTVAVEVEKGKDDEGKDDEGKDDEGNYADIY